MKIGFDDAPAAPAGSYSQHLAKLLAEYAPEHEYIIDGKRCKEFDLYHGFRSGLPFPVILRRIPCVMTVHNLNFLRYPHLYSLTQRLVLLRLYRRMLRSAERLITVNRDAREELSDRLQIDPRKIEVMMPLAVRVPHQAPADAELEAVRRKYGLPRDFVLMLGTVEPRHNHEALFEALFELRERERETYEMERRNGTERLRPAAEGEPLQTRAREENALRREPAKGEPCQPGARSEKDWGDKTADRELLRMREREGNAGQQEAAEGELRQQGMRSEKGGAETPADRESYETEKLNDRGMQTEQSGREADGGPDLEADNTGWRSTMSDGAGGHGDLRAWAPAYRGGADFADMNAKNYGGTPTDDSQARSGVVEREGRVIGTAAPASRRVGVVVCGRRTTYADFLLGYARERHLGAYVDFIYELAPDDLPALFRLARCFVYLPDARIEASIVPVVEALRAGLPMVLSDTQLNREAAGDAAVYVHPEAVGEVAAALENVLWDEAFRHEMHQRERRRAELFSEYAVARRLIDIYSSL